MRNRGGLLAWCLGVIFATAAASAMAAGGGGLKAVHLRCEYLRDPRGIDVTAPRLSWELQSNDATRGRRQTAYRVLVASTAQKLAADVGDLWDSGRVESDQQNQLSYAGAALGSRQRCWWKVRVWDEQGKASAWSEPAAWSMGLLHAEDWAGPWIANPPKALTDHHPRSAAKPGSPADPPLYETSPRFRKVFDLAQRPAHAVVYITSLGYFRLYINGEPIGDTSIQPAVSDYNHRVFYRTIDVSDRLRPGRNCIAVGLGVGWMNETMYRVTPYPQLHVQLEATLENGRRITVAGDHTWRTSAGPIRNGKPVAFGVRGMEVYDAGLEQPGWATPGFDDARWTPAVEQPQTRVAITAQPCETGRVTQTWHAVSVAPAGPGAWRIDMGRNFTGEVEVPLHGPAGQRVVIDYSDRPNARQTFNQRDAYILRGGEGEVFRNHFNYRAFRWITVTGIDRAPDPQHVVARFVRTGYPSAAEFECSNPLLNDIDRTARWTYECLTLGGSIVDCPHRERRGYGAEGQASMETGLFNFCQGAMFTKWLGDWRDVQDLKTGALPNAAPQRSDAWGGPSWGTIVATLPWELYRHYGDTRVLRENNPMMRAYLRWIDAHTRNHVLQITNRRWMYDLGDWLPAYHDPGGKQGSPAAMRCDQFFNNCFVLLYLRRMADIAEVLGEKADAAAYRADAEARRLAIEKEFYNPATQTYEVPEQTYLAFSLLVGLGDPAQQQQLMSKLDHDIRVTRNGHLSSGVLGTYLQIKYLTHARRSDLVALMATQTTYPGWGDMLRRGATTFWEDWPGKHSHIHASYVSIGAWFINSLAGIQIDDHAPGFKHFFIRPAVVGGLTFVHATHHSIRGPIVCNWQHRADRFTLDLTVPPNTTATVDVPCDAAASVTESGKPAAQSPGITPAPPAAPGVATFNVTSGRYHFESALHAAHPAAPPPVQTSP